MDANLSEQYVHKNEIDHVLDTPDTYIGSKEMVSEPMYVYQPDENRIVQKTLEWIPGLYKLFDEAIVNARDHIERMLAMGENGLPVTYVDVAITEDGWVTVTNDGHGVDVALHPTYNVWIPELIFANMRTSTNYNKDEDRIVGGKNGFGVKLVFMWSTESRIEIVDKKRGLKYAQTFGANLREVHPPVISKVAASAKPYTRVAFRADFTRFGLAAQQYPADFMALLERRLYDIAGVSASKVHFKWNGKPLGIKSFPAYVDLYLNGNKKVHEQSHPRWEYAVAL
jgi:DNA topoisomerase-2